MREMTRRDGAAPSAAGRPLPALISGALLMLTVLAGFGGVGGFSTVGRTSSTSSSSTATIAAASTIAVPVTKDRRSAPALGTPRTQVNLLGWPPVHPEVADLPVTGWRPPTDLVDLTVVTTPTRRPSTVDVAHRGRAPPAGPLRS